MKRRIDRIVPGGCSPKQVLIAEQNGVAYHTRPRQDNALQPANVVEEVVAFFDRVPPDR
jgi:hypothetical protein